MAHGTTTGMPPLARLRSVFVLPPRRSQLEYCTSDLALLNSPLDGDTGKKIPLSRTTRNAWCRRNSRGFSMSIESSIDRLTIDVAGRPTSGGPCARTHTYSAGESEQLSPSACCGHHMPRHRCRPGRRCAASDKSVAYVGAQGDLCVAPMRCPCLPPAGRRYRRPCHAIPAGSPAATGSQGARGNKARGSRGASGRFTGAQPASARDSFEVTGAGPRRAARGGRDADDGAGRRADPNSPPYLAAGDRQALTRPRGQRAGSTARPCRRAGTVPPRKQRRCPRVDAPTRGRYGHDGACWRGARGVGRRALAAGVRPSLACGSWCWSLLPHRFTVGMGG
jgi:hypothetical protein